MVANGILHSARVREEEIPEKVMTVAGKGGKVQNGYRSFIDAFRVFRVAA